MFYIRPFYLRGTDNDSGFFSLLVAVAPVCTGVSARQQFISGGER
jgi:hypothetical protein